ncbi:hypothetical protein [Alkalihalobacillus pseudalcaliphilus]|uniref:hypothetical protein n=1 Tax=Alkalihalobacillus pseudalcaliphilus TaxID=79884 RepID=UPI002361316F|nr:hypothetical protein [Alkalihalobacillus pseudalcaliphilus]
MRREIGGCTKRRFMCRYGRRKGWYLYKEAVYVQIWKEKGLVSVQRGGLCADTEGERVGICTKRRFMCRYGRRKGWYLYKEAVYVQIRKEEGLVSVRRGGLCADTEGGRAVICTKRRFMCRYGRRKGCYLYKEAVYVQIWKEKGLLSVQKGGLCADMEGGRVCICTKRRFMCRYGRRKSVYLHRGVYCALTKAPPLSK